MRKVFKHVAALLRRVVWLGMGLQVLLGLVWMLGNMGTEHSFGVDWSSGGPVDRAFMQWGPLYTFVVKLVMGMEQWLPIPYYSIVYCLQLVVAWGSGWFFLKKMTPWGTYGCVGGTVVLLSVPMAMQSHLALVPYSFIGSVVLVQLAWAIDLWKQEQWSLRRVVPMYLFWLLEVLLLPEYLWFGGIPLMLTTVFYLWRNRKKWRTKVPVGVLVLVSILCIWGVGNGWLQSRDGYLNGRQMLAAKCTWSNLYELSGVWSPDVKGQFESAVLRAACGDSEVFYEGFFDQMEQLPEKQQKDYLKQMTLSALNMDTKRVVLEMAYDGIGYLMPGAVIPKQLEGEGFVSLTGINYWYFIQNLTGWSSAYMKWYCVWVWIAAIAAVLVKGMESLCAGRADKRISALGVLKVLFPGLLMALACACFYTISRIGVYDYKILSWWTVLWCAGTLLLVLEKKEE